MRRVGNNTDELGECPTWDEQSARLLRIDVTARRLIRCDIAGADTDVVAVSEMPGSVVLRASGGLLIAYRRRLALRDVAGAETPIDLPPGFDATRERFNDGACDPRGRFWVGTMDRCLKDPVGALYRLDPDLAAHRMAAGFGLSNGIAWSPDATVMYHCDSRPALIHAYDYDGATGMIEDRRTFFAFPEALGIPDGCAVDEDGFLWVAAPHARQVLRFDPHGALERRFDVPALPTGLGFGGPDLRTLFVTSMVPRDGPASERDGSVFALEAPVAGLLKGRFAG